MKSTSISLLLVLITLFSSFQSATAQDKDPPPVQVIDPQTEPLQSSTPFSDAAPQSVPEKTASGDRSSSGLAPSSVDPETNAFFIGDKENPATAHGGDYYAVAYINDGELFVTTFTEDLFEINTFWNLSSRASNPDIAYEASTGLFIVVWQYDYNGAGTDYDIKSLAIDPHPFVGQIGSIIPIAGMLDDETDPSVDCNPYDSSCLVAYTYQSTGSPGIEGRFMDMTSSGVSNSSNPKFEISTTTGYSPYVAMGDYGYMVAYTNDNTISGSLAAWPVFSHVYPTYHSSGDQYRHGTTLVIGSGDIHDDSNDKYSTGVAYDACADKFVVLFTYDWNGDGSDLDVGVGIISSLDQTGYPGFWIAYSFDNEFSADISFIEDYHLTNAPPHASKLVVAYSRWGGSVPEGIYATDLRSNCSETSPSYSSDPQAEHFHVQAASPIFGSSVSQPSITGSGGVSQFLVAWTDITGGTAGYEYDVMGRLMDASDGNSIFLPLIVR